MLLLFCLLLANVSGVAGSNARSFVPAYVETDLTTRKPTLKQLRQERYGICWRDRGRTRRMMSRAEAQLRNLPDPYFPLTREECQARGGHWEAGETYIPCAVCGSIEHTIVGDAVRYYIKESWNNNWRPQGSQALYAGLFRLVMDGAVDFEHEPLKCPFCNNHDVARKDDFAHDIVCAQLGIEDNLEGFIPGADIMKGLQQAVELYQDVNSGSVSENGRQQRANAFMQRSVLGVVELALPPARVAGVSGRVAFKAIAKFIHMLRRWYLQQQAGNEPDAHQMAADIRGISMSAAGMDVCNVLCDVSDEIIRRQDRLQQVFNEDERARLLAYALLVSRSLDRGVGVVPTKWGPAARGRQI